MLTLPYTPWGEVLAAYVRAGFNAAKINIWGGQAIQLVSKISSVLILYVGAKLVIDGKLTVGEARRFVSWYERITRGHNRQTARNRILVVTSG